MKYCLVDSYPGHGSVHTILYLTNRRWFVNPVWVHVQRQSQELNLAVPFPLSLMWLRQCHKSAIWEWFIASIYGDLEDGFLLFYPHCMICSILWIKCYPVLVHGS